MFYKDNYLILERYRAWRLFYGGVRRYYCWIFYESDIKSIEILDWLSKLIKFYINILKVFFCTLKCVDRMIS